MILQPPVAPMLARLARTLPVGEGRFYEPKWDGFRCLSFRTGEVVDLCSRNQRPLDRYFPEVLEALRALPHPHIVLDGELLVIRCDFAALMSRLHPAASRVELLARTTPATLVMFDLLAVDGDVLLDRPFDERRRRLEEVLANAEPPLYVSPSTQDPAVARRWLAACCGNGIDGVVVKDAHMPYEPGRRTMTKVKPERTADCVVAGFRWLADRPLVSSLLLGLYDDERQDVLRHVGVVSSFTDRAREQLTGQLAARAVPLEGHPWEHGFALEGGPMGRLKGAGGRWTPDLERDWVPLAPTLVCEVAYDQVDDHRFRHAARWRRWRPDRSPESCRIDQLDQPAADVTGVLGR